MAEDNKVDWGTYYLAQLEAYQAKADAMKYMKEYAIERARHFRGMADLYQLLSQGDITDREAALCRLVLIGGPAQRNNWAEFEDHQPNQPEE